MLLFGRVAGGEPSVITLHCASSLGINMLANVSEIVLEQLKLLEWMCVFCECHFIISKLLS